MSHSVSTTKYIIHGKVEVEGIVEKPDVVGAVFGQTEGLLGEELDLRELQKTGRIGRIQVTIESEGGKSTGIILIPSSLNRVETSILASALETVDREGNKKVLDCTQRYYTCPELRWLLKHVGFRRVEFFGVTESGPSHQVKPAKEHFELGVIAHK